MRARHVTVFALAASLIAAGCAELKSPAEITEPEVLAIRVAPSAVEFGGEASLELFVVDTGGPISGVSSTWEVGDGIAGGPPIGAVDNAGEGGPVYAAPDRIESDEEAALAILEGTIELPQRDVEAVKTVPIGARIDNPTIERVTVAGEPLEDQGAVAAGEDVTLDVEADIPLGDPGDVTWAVTAGELEQFLRTPVTWSIPEGAGGEAWLYVVVRSAIGGADWAAYPIDIGP